MSGNLLSYSTLSRLSILITLISLLIIDGGHNCDAWNDAADNTKPAGSGGIGHGWDGSMRSKSYYDSTALKTLSEDESGALKRRSQEDEGDVGGSKRRDNGRKKRRKKRKKRKKKRLGGLFSLRKHLKKAVKFFSRIAMPFIGEETEKPVKRRNHTAKKRSRKGRKKHHRAHKKASRAHRKRGDRDE